MIWICIEYTCGEPRRIYHIFRRARLFVADGKLHVHGRTLCGVEYSDESAGSRTDTVFSLIIGVDAAPGHIQAVPMDACGVCQDTRLISNIGPLRVVN